MTAPNLAPPTLTSKDWRAPTHVCGDHEWVGIVPCPDCQEDAENFAKLRAPRACPKCGRMLPEWGLCPACPSSTYAETESLTRPSEPLPVAVGRMVVDEPAVIGSHADTMTSLCLVAAAALIVAGIISFYVFN